jgi:hypothetical protein
MKNNIFNKIFGDNKSSSVPLIVLDLDLTIIGDVILFTWMEELSTRLFGQNAITKKVLFKAFDAGLLRPHFRDFIVTLIKRGCIIVIYTYSTKNWANVVVSALQDYIGIKFVTRLFTREDCNLSNFPPDCSKNLAYVIKTLKAMNIPVTYDRVIMLDDKDILSKREKNNLIKVKPYQFLGLNIIHDIVQHSVTINKNALDLVLTNKLLFADVIKRYVGDEMFLEFMENENENDIDYDSLYSNIYHIIHKNRIAVKTDKLFLFLSREVLIAEKRNNIHMKNKQKNISHSSH